MTIIERMLARKAGLDRVTPGQEITVSVDLALSHDVTAPIAIQQFRQIGASRVYDPKKVVFIMDHVVPAATIDSRRDQRLVKEFADEFGATLYCRAEGVCHQLAYEEGLYRHGDVVVGADSHTCTAGAAGAVAIPVGSTEIAAVMALGELDLEVPETHVIRVNGKLSPFVYGKDVILHAIGRFGTGGFTDRAVVFTGDAIRSLPQEEKMTIANMMIEMGAMIGYIDQGGEDLGEAGAVVHDIDAATLVPVAACPSSPGNVKPLSQVAGVRISQAVLGSCTNGRYRDMEIAAGVLRGRKVADNVNMIVVPASRRILDKMEQNGLTKVFRDAGAVVANPGCGPCFGAHQGLLTKDDVAVSTTNRNFPGRMGDKKAQIYLASPRAVAESAVAGVLARPGTVTQEGI